MPVRKNKSVSRSLRLPRKTDQSLGRHARYRKVSKSSLLREIIENWLGYQGKEPHA